MYVTFPYAYLGGGELDGVTQVIHQHVLQALAVPLEEDVLPVRLQAALEALHHDADALGLHLGGRGGKQGSDREGERTRRERWGRSGTRDQKGSGRMTGGV